VRLHSSAAAGGAVAPCEVRATLGVQTADGRQQYLGVGK
jgi:hypothetical protein